MKRFLKVTGLIALLMGFNIIIQLIGSFVLGIVYAVKNVHLLGDETYIEGIESFITQYTLWVVGIAAVLSILFFMLVCAIRKQKLFSVCKFSRISIINIILLILMGIGMNYFISGLMGIVENMGWASSQLEFHDQLMQAVMGNQSIIMMVLVVGLLAPFFEEILFRGLIFDELRKNTTLAAAIIIQGILFGLFHMNWVQGVYAAILGILFVIPYIWLKSFWAPVILHAVMNLTSVVLSSLSHDSVQDSSVATSEYFVVLIISAAAIALFMFIIKKGTDRDSDEIVDLSI